jgi:hypothetical protein
MLLKAGVDISRLNRPIRRALNHIGALYPDFVITSTYEGTHSPGSLHYANDAIDIRMKTFHRTAISVDRLKEVLGPDFDIIRERNHIHIEYDPKGR